MGRIRLLLVDDHPIIREGLRSLLGLQEGIEVVGEARDGQEGLTKALDLRPDIILMDIRMARLNGVEATRQIKSRIPEARIIILTSYDEDEQVFEAIRAGADGYVLKDANPDQLLSAIRAVAEGYALMSTSIARRLRNEFPRSSHRRDMCVGEQRVALTTRESEVLSLIAQGHSNQEIAAALFISQKTVKTHISNIFAKLRVNDRSQAALHAARLGMVG